MEIQFDIWMEKMKLLQVSDLIKGVENEAGKCDQDECDGLKVKFDPI